MAAEKYDDVLLPFLSLMRKELHANSGKGDRPGWLAMRPDEALLEVYYHLAKLQKAVKHNDGPAIMEYSADVANMAMMVLDICGGIAWAALDASGLDASRCTYPNCACAPNGDAGCNNPNAAARGVGVGHGQTFPHHTPMPGQEPQR